MKTFLQTSRAHLNRVTELFQFVWPAAAAMWNLRWQVKGYLAERNATDAELYSRFTLGSGITGGGGANLRKAVSQPWEEQQQVLARFLLSEFCAVYESWIGTVLTDFNVQDNDWKRLEKGLQFPKKGTRGGAWESCLELAQNGSTVLADAFYGGLLQNQKNAKANLDNLLVCYRYFKECRNALMHNGGRANSTTEKASQEYQTLSPSELQAPEVPRFASLKSGDRISLDLRGIVGFSDVIIKIITTLDAELAVAKASESHFCSLWGQCLGKVDLKRYRPERQDSRFCKLVTSHLSLPDPACSPRALMHLLSTEDLLVL